MKFKFVVIVISFLAFNLPGQDLKVVSLEFEQVQTSYQKFSGIITLKNTDEIDIVDYSVTRLYISVDTIYDVNDKYFASEGFWGLESKQSKSMTFSGGAAQFGINVSQGDYFIIAVVDSRNEIEETNEHNNYFFTPITILPASVDYTFSSASKDKIHVSKGDIVNFTYTLTNLETNNVSSLYTTFYLSADNVLDKDDIKWSSVYNGIKWQTNFTNSISLTVPFNLTEEYYYVFAKIENYGQEVSLVETNLNNDTIALESFKIIVAERDLSISDLIVTSMDFTHVSIESKITNISESGQQGYGLKFYFSEDEILDDDDRFFVIFPYHNHPSQYLPPNQTQEKRNYTIAHDVNEYLPPGRWFLIAHINYDFKLDETDFSNNYAVSNQIEIADYEVSVEVQELTSIAGSVESSDQLSFNVGFRNENFQNVLIYHCELRDTNGRTLQRDVFLTSLSIYELTIRENIIWQLDSPLKEGNYTLVITSNYTTTYKHEFHVDGLFNNLEENLDNENLTLSWGSSILNDLDNFEISLVAESFDSTFYSPSSHLVLERQTLIPGDYEWTVSTNKNGQKFASETRSLTILPISTEVESISLDTDINDLESLITITIAFTNENYSGNLDYEVQITDINGAVVWNTFESIDFGTSTKGGRLSSDKLFSQQLQILLDKPLKKGTYSLSIISDFASAYRYDFTVLPAVSSQESVIDSDKITIMWDESFPPDIENPTIYIYGENYDSTYVPSGQDQLIISTNHLEPGVYSWYISFNKNDEIYRSDTAHFTIERILGTEDDNFGKSLKISPNPANKFIFIEDKEIAQVIIFNIQGKLIKKIVKNDPSIITQVDVSDIDEGVYIIQIVKRKNYKVETRKLVINR